MTTQAIVRALPRRRPGGLRPLERASTRRVITELAAVLVVAAVSAGLTYYFQQRGSLLPAAALIVVAGSAWFAGTSRPGLALALLMVYLGALDGYLKLATGSSLVTFLRDILLYATVIGLLVRAIVTRRPLPLPPLSGWVVLFTLLVLVQTFNPDNGSALHTLAGLRQNLEFVPLFFLTFAFVRTKRALRMFVLVLVGLAVANGVVNVVQSRLSPQQLASWGPGYRQRVLGTNHFALGGRTFYDATGQQHTRPFGLMSDAGTGGLVGAFALGGILALASLRVRRRWPLLAGLAAAITAAGIVTSQGRAVLVGSFIVVAAYGAMTARSRQWLTTIAVIAAFAGVAYGVASAVSSGAASRYAGLNTSTLVSTTAQARGTALAAIPGNLLRHPLGAGLGSGGPAAGQAGGPSAALNANAETEISFATLEAGIPGMLALVGFTGLVFWLGLRRCRLEPDPEARLLLAAVIAPVAGMFVLYWASALSPTTPSGPYLWAAGGIASYWLVAKQRSLPLSRR